MNIIVNNINKSIYSYKSINQFKTEYEFKNTKLRKFTSNSDSETNNRIYPRLKGIFEIRTINSKIINLNFQINSFKSKIFHLDQNDQINDFYGTSQKMCVYLTSILKLKNQSFFSINSIINYKYNNLENIIRNIKIYYLFSIFYIKITILKLSRILLQQMFNIPAKILGDVKHLFARGR